MTTRIAFQTAMRAAAVQLLEDFAADVGVRLQVYRARPISIHPPTAFIDSIAEDIEYAGPTMRQRTPRVQVVVLHGLFDSGEAVDQRDAFVDAFMDWVTDRYHAAAGSTLLAVTATEDVPNFIADWLAPTIERRAFYATQITLEGFANG